MDLDKMELLPQDSERKFEFAIKIFKTSILIFKDRERYVSGEFRFRKGHCKSNPRKMV
jgi:RIO kinase 1